MQQRIKILSVSDRDEANYLKTDSTIQKLEQQADEYSKNILIPESDYLRFINTTKTFQEKVIIDFANDLGIHPGNVVRRLQNDKILPKKTGLNNLKVKYNLQKIPV